MLPAPHALWRTTDGMRSGGHDVEVAPDPGPAHRPQLASTSSPTPAQRSGRPGWRDPRLWTGVLVVAASVVLGVRVVAGLDDTVQVWAVTDDLGPGVQVGAEDLTATRVRFADEADLGRYLPVETELPSGATLTRGLGAGELLPRSALGDPDRDGTVRIALGVDDVGVPAGVGAGSVIDVYLLGGGSSPGSPEVGSARQRRDRLVLDDATVLSSTLEQGFGSGGRRKLELAVPAPDAPRYFSLVAGATEPVLGVALQR